MINCYTTYATFELRETYRMDSRQQITMVIVKNYKGNLEIFYVNNKDTNQVKALKALIQSKKQMFITAGVYRRSNLNKRYLTKVENKQFN